MVADSDNQDRITGLAGPGFPLIRQIRNPNTEIRNKSEIRMFQGPKPKALAMVRVKRFLGFGRLGFGHLVLFRI
jgi:hypothetical protein